jgi:hypothetical protein
MKNLARAALSALLLGTSISSIAQGNPSGGVTWLILEDEEIEWVTLIDDDTAVPAASDAGEVIQR